MVNQPGYLYGTGDPFPRVGPKDKWHWRAEDGIAIPRWVLYNGNKEIGLELYATHESIDVPDLLAQTLTGLNT
jgi:hypothetical protein